MQFISPDPLTYCAIGELWFRPGTRVVGGNSYLYELGRVRTEAAAARLHLDAWFLRQVATQFARHRPTHACVLFLGTGADQSREFFRLTLSERSGALKGTWLADIPGFFELGAEPLPSNSHIWAVWRDGALARVHDFLGTLPSGLMVTDIGGRPGITIFTDRSEEEYDEIASDPVERWDYCPIPREFTEQFEVGGGSRVHVRHLAYNSYPVIGDDEEWDDAADDDLRPAEAPEQALPVDELNRRIASRLTRAAALVEACELRATACIPAIAAALDQLNWAEVETVRDALPLLAPEITGALIGLLVSERKQTAEVVTTALGRIADPLACGPLVDMMKRQVGTANAIRARDALIAIGEAAVASLVGVLGSPQWETRMYAAQALGAIGDAGALGSLRSAAQQDRSAKVRDAAAEAVAALAGEGEA